MITGKTDEAIDRGLAYLNARANHRGSFGTGGYTGNVAVTSLAALAFMAHGDMPNRGPYGRIVTNALKFILSQENRDGGHPGFLHNPQASPHGPMYGHGFATLFLAEASGMVHAAALRKELDDKLHLAVKLILNSQNPDGGWRYTPESRDADISVTICQIMALRAARNAGIFVPKSKVDKCVEYVKSCQDRNRGYFRYMKQGGGGGGAQGFARTAAGVCASVQRRHLQRSGDRAGTGISTTIAADDRRLAVPTCTISTAITTPCRPCGPPAAATGRSGIPPSAMNWWAGRRLDGSWMDQICSHYATAMACIILQVPNNYLPILQK